MAKLLINGSLGHQKIKAKPGARVRLHKNGHMGVLRGDMMSKELYYTLFS